MSTISPRARGSRLGPDKRYEVVAVLGVVDDKSKTIVYHVRDSRPGSPDLVFKECANPADAPHIEREARAMMQASGRGVVDLKELLKLGDGWGILMPLLKGQTLESRWAAGRPEEDLELLLQIARVIGRVHERCIAHGDLHPGNIIIDPYGDPTIIDWGSADAPGIQGSPGGWTEGFVAPERRGACATLSSDVFSFGVLLKRSDRGALTGLAQRCLAETPDRRPPYMGEVARELEQLLHELGDTRRAAPFLERARMRLAAAERCWGEAEEANRTSATSAEALWELEQQAAEAERDAMELETNTIHDLSTACSLGRETPAGQEAADLLGDLYVKRAERDERAGKAAVAEAYEGLVEQLGREKHQRWLSRMGSFEVEVWPSEMQVSLYQVEKGLRWEARRNSELPPGRIRQMEVKAGSWLLHLRHNGVEAWLPMVVKRGERWTVRAPVGDDVIRLPHRLRPHEVFVPKGWFRAGGDRGATGGLPPSEVWVDDLIGMRDPVTCREGLRWILAKHEALRGEQEVDPNLLPCHSNESGERRYLIQRSGDTYVHGKDLGGRDWGPDLPLACVTVAQANAYAAWLNEADAAQLGASRWRLPHELEWEKLARGVDGRPWPWGDRFHRRWAQLYDTVESNHGPVAVGTPAEDVSVYRARGVVGNVQQWCSNAWTPRLPVDSEGRMRVDLTSDASSHAQRSIRGGSWMASEARAAPACRTAAPPERAFPTVGFRLVRSVQLNSAEEGEDAEERGAGGTDEGGER